jgi:ribosomal protein S27E
MTEKIESVACWECGETDVSYSPETNEAYCWFCKRRVSVIIRTVKQ